MAIDNPPTSVPRLSPRDRRNTLCAAVGDAFWGLSSGVVASATVLVVLLTKLGASKTTIGFIGAVEGTGMVLPQVLGPFLFRNRAKLKAHLVGWHIFVAIPFLLAMALLTRFSHALPAAFVSAALLCCWGGFNLGVGVVIASWIDWMGQVYDPRTRGTTIGLIIAASSVASIVAQLVAGWLIASDSSVQGYARHYLLATLAALASMGVYALLDDPGHSDGASTLPSDIKEMVSHIRTSLADPSMFRFLTGRALGTLGFCVGPFLALYFRSAPGGGLSDQLLVSCGAAGAVGSALGSAVFGRLGDRFGHRWAILGATAMQIVTLVLVLCTHGPISCAAVFALSGLASGGVVIAQFNLLLDTSPHASRVSHIAAGNLALIPAVALGPLSAAWVAEHFGLSWLFIASLVISAAAVAWFAVFYKGPRRA